MVISVVDAKAVTGQPVTSITNAKNADIALFICFIFFLLQIIYCLKYDAMVSKVTLFLKNIYYLSYHSSALYFKQELSCRRCFIPINTWGSTIFYEKATQVYRRMGIFVL